MSSIGCALQKVAYRLPKRRTGVKSKRWLAEMCGSDDWHSSKNPCQLTISNNNNDVKKVERCLGASVKLDESPNKANSQLQKTKEKSHFIPFALVRKKCLPSRYDNRIGLALCTNTCSFESCQRTESGNQNYESWTRDSLKRKIALPLTWQIPQRTMASVRSFDSDSFLTGSRFGQLQCRTFVTLTKASEQRAMSFSNQLGGYILCHCCMAGHSKWQNIKHIKSSKDAKRANMFSKLAVRIKVAVREGGGDDPKFNNQLARMINEAKANDMPNASISTAIKSAAGKDSGTLQMVELRGPGPCLWLVEAMTDKLKRVKAELAGRVKRLGCNVTDGNTVIQAFEKKGLVEVEVTEDQDVNMDEYLDVAIETGAEDVEEQVDELEARVLAFSCDADDLHAVRKALEGRGYPVKSGSIIYIPRAPAILAESEVEGLQKIVEKIQDHPEVVRIFDNIQVT